MTSTSSKSSLSTAWLGAVFALTALSRAAEPRQPNVHADVPTGFTTIAQDARLSLTMHPPIVVMDHGGAQPYLFATAGGTMFCQAQMIAKPFNTKGKMTYGYRIETAISRDGGLTWAPWTHQANHDDVFIEGGAVQCADGSILMLDTFVMQGATPNQGVGELWTSHDDLRTLDGPRSVGFDLPGISWNGSTDDGGHPHNAARLHRSIIELPNGDLLTTGEMWFSTDRAPCPYMPTMMKTRTSLMRSRDHGAHWAYLATVAVDGAVGTEGFGEPALVCIATGPHAGRLLCLMRTGRELYGAHSDDAGLSWSRALPVSIPGIDVYATAKWEKLFVDPTAPDYVPSDRLYGAVVDPDLIQLHDGTLMATIGVRTPEKKCFKNWRAATNGDYLAFSCDGGDTWTEVIQFLSGQPTTQYMGIREIKPGVVYVTYDDSVWQSAGRTMGFQLDVHRR